MARERHISSTVLPSAWPASTCRSSLTICSGEYVLVFMVVLSGPSWAVLDSHTTWTNFRVADHCLGQHLGLAVADPVAFDGTIREASRYSLLRRNRQDRSLSVHRLVQAVERDQMGEEGLATWLRAS